MIIVLFYCILITISSESNFTSLECENWTRNYIYFAKDVHY
jgi:hypothetical protein